MFRKLSRPLRRIRRGFATADPDRARLLLAVSTIATLLVVALVLFVLATVTAQPVTAVIPGIVLAMIASLAVREPTAGPRAVTILLLAPSSFLAIALGSLVSGTALVADVVFVAVAVAAVLLRAIGPRGTAIGMVAFMSYFLALFIKTTPAQLPVVAAAVVAAALVCIAMRLLLRPRHPDRNLQRMVSALGLRAGRVIDVLEAGARNSGFDERLKAILRARIEASGSTASSVEQTLEAEDEPVIHGIGNDELGVRVFDFQLAIEHLAATVDRFLWQGQPIPSQRVSLATDLAEFAEILRGPVRLSKGKKKAAAPAGIALEVDSREIISADEAAKEGDAGSSLARVLGYGLEAWNSVAFPAAGDLVDRPAASVGEPDETHPGTATGAADEPDEPDEPDERDAHEPRDKGAHKLQDAARQSVQVAVAAALAIAVGTALSSSRWYWAVIAAFVVYIGTSTRGEILSKGWQRVLGTLAGVIAGVVIAVLVGGNTLLAVVLIAGCLFLGVYLMSLSSAIMIFFITTMLALIYGLLGMFSVDLLLIRLEETVAGAAIGVLVSYVVLPSSTRDAARAEIRDFLAQLRDAIGSAVAALADSPAGDANQAHHELSSTRTRDPRSTPEDAKELREAFAALKATTKPLTHGLAGVSNRSGSRRTLQILAACEYHARALLRLSDAAVGVADTSALRRDLEAATRAVQKNIDTLAENLGERMSDVTLHDAGSLVDALEEQAESLSSSDRLTVLAAARHLQAIDQSIGARARELAARA